MNDIYVWLIILGIVYILPEIFGQNKKKKGKGRYEYPQFPDTHQVPEEKIPQTAKKPKPQADYPDLGYEYYPSKPMQQEQFHFTLPKAVPAPAASPLPPPVNVPATVTSSVSPWQGVLTPQVLANAVVFSEIILPPRAHRPFGRQNAGRNRR